MGILMKIIEEKKKWILIGIVISISIWLLGTFVALVTSDYIYSATVNEKNGNISYLSSDYNIFTFNKEGSLIYSQKLQDAGGGYGRLYYFDGELHVQVSRSTREYVLNEKGEIVWETKYKESPVSWKEWTKTPQGYEYVVGKKVYKYNFPSFFFYLFHKEDAEISFVIEDMETQKTVYLWKFKE